VAGSLAYVASGESGLTIINVSNPANPVLVGRFSLSGYTRDCSVSGSFVYLAHSLRGVVAVDVSNPARPRGAAWFNTPGATCGVEAAGDYIYAADQIGGLHVLSVNAPPPKPPRFASLDLNAQKQARLVLNGTVGARYYIEWTDAPGGTNAWTATAVLALTNSTQEWTDPESASQPRRFYRAMLKP